MRFLLDQVVEVIAYAHHGHQTEGGKDHFSIFGTQLHPKSHSWIGGVVELKPVPKNLDLPRAAKVHLEVHPHFAGLI